MSLLGSQHPPLHPEPGLFQTAYKPTDTHNEVRLSGYQIGKDCLILRRILDSAPGFQSSIVVGPDVLVNGTILRE